MGKIGKNIKKIRNVKGISQQAFADLFSLSRGNISSYEELRAEPRIETIINIAKYFGIPLEDFITKDLSVNELLHYNTELVLETEKLKRTHQFVNIPYISIPDIADYTANYNDETFLKNLPHIVVPSSSKFKLIAMEIDNPEQLPLGFDFKTGDILIFENVVKENMHRINSKLGIMINEEGLHSGIFEESDHKIYLTLNEWVKYPFNIESDSAYWVLRLACTHIA